MSLRIWLKNVLAVEAVELERAVLEPPDHVVLLLVGQRCEGLAAEFLAAGGIESGQRLAILLRDGQRRLRALLLGAFLERPHHVEGFVAAVGTGKLPVDEHRTAAILAARRLRIGRDEAIDERFDRRRFVRA